MFYRGKYVDAGDGREMGLKRQRVVDQGSQYYNAPQASSFIYSPPAYSYVNQPPTFPVVRLRGLPYDVTEADITEFLHGLDIVDVLFANRHGKFQGEVYCVLGYAFQVEYALQKNHQNMGRRYIEVFRSNRQEYYKAISNLVTDSRGGGGFGGGGGGGARSRSPRRGPPKPRAHDPAKDNMEHTGVLRLRGLPFTADRDDLVDFFEDWYLAEDSTCFMVNSEGRVTGEAYVKFGSPEVSKAAMVKDGMSLGNRYIELFPSTMEEWEEAVTKGRTNVPKPSEEDTPVLRMRGLPFSAGKDDIVDFFKEFTLTEDSVHITYNSEGRATGEAFVEFASLEDSKAALAKDRMTLGSRYIELFMSSPEELRDAVSRGR
ncbi:Nucleotide-binding, alpha-beta plait [Artemisia annua]|uniref:Nucleotide-binding, alpha-beta plait n=1 Tax=Artemisia annua TaxID=35608 RepID=A0A2U1KTS1_ARTAN|nr:Nucleotide-binding, alpha-beta plait [Artemisia annua]